MNRYSIKEFLNDRQRRIEILLTLGGIFIGTVALIVEDKGYWAIGGYSFSIAAFIFLERFETFRVRAEFIDSQSAIVPRLDRIDFYLKASVPDKLTVALFDHLLIYLPLYVADFSGYLKEENIELVKYDTKGSDELVAKAVWSNEADIGLCDPCMCAQKEFRRKGDELLILTPLVTKASARPVTKHEAGLRATLLKGGDIRIATYSSPSTTFVMAVSLKEQLAQKNAGKTSNKIKITLDSKKIEDFHTANLANLLDNHELVMLWEPFLTIAERSPEVECFVLDQTLSSALPDAMYSALVISQRLLSEKPTLGIRLFRALSRASHKMQLAAENSPLRIQILEAARRRIAFPSSGFDADSLVQKMIREGIFPLIDNPEALYRDATWKTQLFEAIQYRKKAIVACPGQLGDNFVDIPNLEKCLDFFCSPNVFKPTEIEKVVAA